MGLSSKDFTGILSCFVEEDVHLFKRIYKKFCLLLQNNFLSVWKYIYLSKCWTSCFTIKYCRRRCFSSMKMCVQVQNFALAKSIRWRILSLTNIFYIWRIYFVYWIWRIYFVYCFIHFLQFNTVLILPSCCRAYKLFN